MRRSGFTPHTLPLNAAGVAVLLATLGLVSGCQENGGTSAFSTRPPTAHIESMLWQPEGPNQATASAFGFTIMGHEAAAFNQVPLTPAEGPTGASGFLSGTTELLINRTATQGITQIEDLHFTFRTPAEAEQVAKEAEVVEGHRFGNQPVNFTATGLNPAPWVFENSKPGEGVHGYLIGFNGPIVYVDTIGCLKACPAQFNGAVF